MNRLFSFLLLISLLPICFSCKKDATVEKSEGSGIVVTEITNELKKHPELSMFTEELSKFKLDDDIQSLTVFAVKNDALTKTAVKGDFSPVSIYNRITFYLIKNYLNKDSLMSRICLETIGQDMLWLSQDKEYVYVNGQKIEAQFAAGKSSVFIIDKILPELQASKEGIEAKELIGEWVLEEHKRQYYDEYGKIVDSKTQYVNHPNCTLKFTGKPTIFQGSDENISGIYGEFEGQHASDQCRREIASADGNPTPQSGGWGFYYDDHDGVMKFKLCYRTPQYYAPCASYQYQIIHSKLILSDNKLILKISPFCDFDQYCDEDIVTYKKVKDY